MKKKYIICPMCGQAVKKYTICPTCGHAIKPYSAKSKDKTNVEIHLIVHDTLSKPEDKNTQFSDDPTWTGTGAPWQK